MNLYHDGYVDIMWCPCYFVITPALSSSYIYVSYKLFLYVTVYISSVRANWKPHVLHVCYCMSANLCVSYLVQMFNFAWDALNFVGAVHLVLTIHFNMHMMHVVI